MQTDQTTTAHAARTSIADELKNRSRDCTLVDGAVVTLRPAEERDAQALHEMFVEMVSGRLYTLQEPDEIGPRDEAYHRKFIEYCRTHSRCMLLLVEAAGAPVGYIQATPRHIQRILHIASLSMYLRPDWRGRGLGRLLMSALIEWATVNPELEKLALSVFSNNPRAIRLYERAGFAVDGRDVRGVKFGDDDYADVISMFLFV